ncbi:MAG: hypothetical protein WC359_12305 [Dehalococcoidia bacterium]|jgi:hypothetical protein
MALEILKSVRTATITIAANDASSREKSQADFLCNGINDDWQILAAVDALPLGGGIISFSTGHFKITKDQNITKDNVIGWGQGWNTIFDVKDQPITSLTAQLNIGDSIVHVVSTADFYAGESIGIGLVPDSYVIQSVDSSTQLTLTTPATAVYVIGSALLSIMSTFYFTGDGCGLCNLKINGNNTNWPSISTDCGAAYEIDFYNGHRFLLDRVEITNSRHRPFRGRGLDCILSRSYMHDMAKEGGVHIEGVAGGEFSNVTIVDSTFIMPSGIGALSPAFLASFGRYLKIDNSHFYGGCILRVVNDSSISGSTLENNDEPTECYFGVRGCKNLKVNDCSLNGEKLAIANITIGILYETDNVLVDVSTFNNANITVAASTKNINITNDAFLDVTGKNPIDMTGGAGTEIIGVNVLGNTFNNCTGGGNYCTKFGYVIGLNFEDNIEYGCSMNQFYYCDNINIKDPQIINPTTHGLRFSNTTDIIIDGTFILGSTFRGISLEAGSATPVLIKNSNISATTPYYNAGTYTNVTYKDNQNYIAPGEVRTASVPLVAGAANDIGFSWHNPELQDILIKKVTIEVTTVGGTAGSHLDVGIADDAAGTNRGVEFFDDLDLNAAQVNDSWVGGDGGTQTKYVVCQDVSSATDGWIVGQILDANAASLVGRVYIEYIGK